jgi:hypothetical protein
MYDKWIKDKAMEKSKLILKFVEHAILELEDETNNVAAKMILYFLTSDNDQRALASTIVRGDMTGLERNQTDLIRYEDESDDKQDDELGVLEDDISESSMEENVSEDTGHE